MHIDSPLISILLILVAALTAATILNRLKQPTLIGFILGGVLIGPHVLGLVPFSRVELLAELGVGLLMFTIGLELSLKKLLRVKNIAILGGTLQITSVIVVTVVILLGFGFNVSQSLLFGAVIALSSTAVVLRLLVERGEIGSTHGNINTGILLFQDIMAVPMLTIVPLLGQQAAIDPKQLITLIGQFTVYVIGLYTAAKFLVPIFLRVVAKSHSHELFSISILSVCLGIASLAHAVGLSLALGAFLAGLIVSESEFGNQATTDILPLKDAFSAIFFASIGMLLGPSVFIESWYILIIALLATTIGKAVLTTSIAILFRYPIKTALLVGFGLAQIGEFSFLLLVAGIKNDIINNNLYQIGLATALLSIIATPYLNKLAPLLAEKLKFLDEWSWLRRHEGSQTNLSAHQVHENSDNHVLLCGFGPTGSIVMKKLEAVGVNVVVIDLNFKIIQQLKRRGIKAIYGDCSSIHVLKSAGIQQAQLLIITIPDPNAIKTLIKRVKLYHPKLPVLARVKYNSEREKLLALGADHVIWEEYEAGQELARQILQRLELRAQPNIAENQSEEPVLTSP